MRRWRSWCPGRAGSCAPPGGWRPWRAGGTARAASRPAAAAGRRSRGARPGGRARRRPTPPLPRRSQPVGAGASVVAYCHGPCPIVGAIGRVQAPRRGAAGVSQPWSGAPCSGSGGVAGWQRPVDQPCRGGAGFGRRRGDRRRWSAGARGWAGRGGPAGPGGRQPGGAHPGTVCRWVRQAVWRWADLVDAVDPQNEQFTDPDPDAGSMRSYRVYWERQTMPASRPFQSRLILTPAG
jgi:hypothetical protein